MMSRKHARKVLGGLLGGFVLLGLGLLVVFGTASATAAGKPPPPPPPPPPPANPVIAYNYNRQLWVANADGTNATMVYDPAPGNTRQPNWSPDMDPGTPGYQGSVVFGTGDGITGCMRAVDISVVNGVPVASNLRSLYCPGNGGNSNLWAPEWSPRGDRLAFILEDRGTNPYSYSINTVDIATQTPAQHYISPISDTYALTGLGFSPDGTKVSFREWVPGVPGGAAIRVVDINTNEVTTVWTGVNIGIPSVTEWSHSGNYLLFDIAGCMGGNKRYQGTWMINLDTGATTRVTPENSCGHNPIWSADDSEVWYWAQGRSGQPMAKINLATGVETVFNYSLPTPYDFNW